MTDSEPESVSEAEAVVDTAECRSYLAAELDSPVIDTEVLHDGLNLSVAVSTADGREYVLRRPRKLRHTSYINEVDREYAVLEGLAGTAIPTPEPVCFCEDESLLGGPFFVTTHLEGEAIPLGSDLPERFRNPGARERLAHRLVDTLAEIHSLDVEPFEGACKRVSARERVDRAAERLEEATAVTGHDVPTLRSVGEWLRRNVPEDSGTSLAHGDFRPGNVLFAERERPTVTGVLDWETALLGDPLSELGYLLLRWRDEGDPTPSLDGLAARHGEGEALRELRERNERGLAPFTARPGSPTRRELVARYEAATGLAFEHERFHRALAGFELATVWEDLHAHQVEAGAETAWEPHIEYMALLAEGIVRGELEL